MICRSLEIFTTGFEIIGSVAYRGLGVRVGVKDMNGDGVCDMILDTAYSHEDGWKCYLSTELHVIYGVNDTTRADVNISSMNTTTGVCKCTSCVCDV